MLSMQEVAILHAMKWEDIQVKDQRGFTAQEISKLFNNDLFEVVDTLDIMLKNEILQLKDGRFFTAHPNYVEKNIDILVTSGRVR